MIKLNQEYERKIDIATIEFTAGAKGPEVPRRNAREVAGDWRKPKKWALAT